MRAVALVVSRPITHTPLDARTMGRLNPAIEVVALFMLFLHATEARHLLIGGLGINSSIALADLNTMSGSLSILSVSQAGGPAPAFLAWTRTPAGALSPIIVGNHVDPPQPGISVGMTCTTWRAPGAANDTAPNFLVNESSAALDRSAHVTVHPSAKWAFSASYAKGSISLVKISHNNTTAAPILGKPVTLPVSMVGVKAHEVKLSPKGNWLYVPCLGDEWVRMFSFNSSSGDLTPLNYPSNGPRASLGNRAPVPAGSGPRHLAFHPTLPVAYLLNELASTVARFDWDRASSGLLRANFTAEPQRIVSMLPPQAPANGSSNSSTSRQACFWQAGAELALSSDGKFLYASNRGSCGGVSNIVLFAIDQSNGALVAKGWWGVDAVPRHISLTPDKQNAYLLVANQYKNSVTVFKRDSMNGKLTKGVTVSTVSATGGVMLPSFIAAL